LNAAGLDKFDVSLENQTADVWAPKDTVDSKAIIQKVLKTGKTVNSVTINGETVDLAPIRAEL
jgi:copper chaperone CopZ